MLPFRLGTTSFIYRAGWSENVARLAGRVKDVELLCFDATHPSDLPDAAEIERLRALGEQHGLTYSVHTPLDASLASMDEARRQGSVLQVLKVIEALRGLSPHAWVLHMYLGDCEHDPRKPSDLDAWRKRAERSITALLASGVPASALCVESLDYDLELIAPLVDRYGLSIALDVGHLHRDGRQLAAALDRYLSRTRLIQWHGTDPKDRDHRSLEHYPESDARWLVKTLLARNFKGVLTLEVFREEDFEASLALTLAWIDGAKA